jgi:predicted DNA-binding mobile mystery protein A
MKKREIVRDQLDNKFIQLQKLDDVLPPSSGWIHAIRYALNMSMRQLGKRLSITPQSVRDLEERERNGAISLKKLQQVASAMNLKFVYGFIPADKTLEAMIEKRARALAEKIVGRTSIQMNLEDQAISKDRLKKAISDKTEEFTREVPKILWE